MTSPYLLQPFSLNHLQDLFMTHGCVGVLLKHLRTGLRKQVNNSAAVTHATAETTEKVWGRTDGQSGSVIRWPQWSWKRTSNWVCENVLIWARWFELWDAFRSSSYVWNANRLQKFQVIGGFWPQMKSDAGWRPESCVTVMMWIHILQSFQSFWCYFGW